MKKRKLKNKILPVRVFDRIYIDGEKLPPECCDALFDLFVYRNPDIYKLQALGYSTRGKPKFISSISETKNVLAVSRGCRQRVRGILKEFGIASSWHDETLSFSGDDLLDELIENNLDASLRADGIILRADQLAVSESIRKFPESVVDAVCSAGKTEIVLHSVSRSRQPTIVLVHTRQLLYQWFELAQRRFGLPIGENGIGIFGDGKKQNGKFVVGSIKTISNIVERDPDFVNRFGFVVLDEGHHAPARTFQELVESFPAKNRTAVTGSLKRRDGKTFLIHDLFGEVRAKITDDELISIGAVMPVKVFAVKTNFYFDYRNKDLIDRLEAAGKLDEFEGAKNRIATINKFLQQSGIPRREFHDFMEKAIRSKSRNEIIVDIVAACVRRNEPTLILSNRTRHCRLIQRRLRERGIDAGLMLGGQKYKKETERTEKEMRDGNLLVGVGTSVADEGLNIRRLTNVIITGTGAGNDSRIKQQAGRTKRLFDGKTEARLIYLWDWKIQSFAGDVRKLKSIFKNAQIISSVREMEKQFWRKESKSRKRKLTN